MLLLVCFLGFVLRVWQLHSLPPGLYHDEGFYALDAVSVLDGHYAIYFPANNGREPLFIYLLALSIKIFGRTAWAVRLPAAFIGTLLIPATYFLGRALFQRRIALLGAAVTAFTFYPVALSRLGFRAGILPLVAALAVGALWLGLKRRDWRLEMAGGALYGLTFYTYVAARLTPIALGLFAIYLWLSGRAQNWRKFSRSFLRLGLAALVVALPLLVYAGQFPQVFFQRTTEISILSHAQALPELARNLFSTLGMFWFTGDYASRPRQNIPGRPFFDPVMSVFAAVGVVMGLYQMFRRSRFTPVRGQARDALSDPAGLAFTFIWMAVLLLPTILTVEAPYFLRAAGILPFVSFLPALGVEAVIRRLKNRWGALLASLALAANFLITARAYFGTYAHDPQLFYSFEMAGTKLAEEINATSAPVFVDRRYWTYYTETQFLTRDPARVTVFDEGTPLAPTPGAALFVWPYQAQLREALAVLPPGSLITARAGPLFKNDFDAEPYSFYSAYAALPAPAGAWRATFTNGLGVQSASVTRTPSGLRLEIVWGAGPTPGGEYHVFAQAIAPDGFVLAQSDGVPAEGLYPTSWWRPGDFVAEARELELDPDIRPKLIIGLYNPLTGERLRLNLGADFVDVTP